MFRKLLITLLFVLVSLFVTNYSFASSNDMMNDGKNIVNGMMQDAQKFITDATDGIKDTTNDITSDINKNEDSKNNNQNSDNSDDNSTLMFPDGRNGGSYSASRTTATDTTTTNSFVWIIIALSIFAVVSLIWFYNASTTENHQ